MQISLVLTRCFKLSFCLNLLLWVIMFIILSMNLAQISSLTGEGPIVVFIIDIISNGTWFFATMFMIFAYLRFSLKAIIFHVSLMAILWILKVTELVLTSILVKSSKDEDVLVFGNKTSTIAGLAVDVTIIIPLTIVAILAGRYLFLRNKEKQQLSSFYL